MTTLIESLQAVLAPLAAGGSWKDINSTEPPVYPFIVFRRISSTSNVSMQGPSALQNTRVQIDIFSRQASEADTLAKAVDAALLASSLVVVPLTSQDMYEDAVRAFRVMRDYSIWSTN